MVVWLAMLLLCVRTVFIAILKSWAGCLGRICVVFSESFQPDIGVNCKESASV